MDAYKKHNGRCGGRTWECLGCKITTQTWKEFCHAAQEQYLEQTLRARQRAVRVACDVSGSGRRQNVCLVEALRSLGVHVPYSCDGPFWALADGNDWLRPRGFLGCKRFCDCVLQNIGRKVLRLEKVCKKQIHTERSCLNDSVRLKLVASWKSTFWSSQVPAPRRRWVRTSKPKWPWQMVFPSPSWGLCGPLLHRGATSGSHHVLIAEWARQARRVAAGKIRRAPS